MFKKVYTKYILRYPLGFLSVFLLAIFILGFYSSKLQIDASAETLLLEDDKDLAFARKMSKRYASLDSLVITFSPKDDLLSKESILTLKNISNDLLELKNTKSLTSILNVPLLQSPVQEISELIKNINTLENKNIDKTLVKKEFLNSPLYKNNLVSSDFKTSAILVHLKDGSLYSKLLEKRNFLLKQEKNKNFSKEDKKYLHEIQKEFKEYRDKKREENHQNILNIRKILKKYENQATLFLGGVSMIADDIVSFVRSDLLVYGLSLVFLLILILWIIFRQIRWVVLPILICVLSVASTAGILGLFSWEITVISSNFIALQLIITISIVLHLIVRYRELCLKYTKSSQKRLILNTILSKINPSFFAIITTIAGFASLILSNIQPVINLGLMMSAGIFTSLIISFIIFPVILVKLEKTKPFVAFENSFSFTSKCADIVQYKPKLIFYSTIIIIIFSYYGSTKLIVENSFISYFKQSTQIYKGMKIIDEKLGGTTPLDLIVNFSNEKEEDVEVEEDEDLDSFEDEFQEENSKEQYWFEESKMKKIIKIHDYLNSLEEVGAVQSLATLLKIGKTINKDEDLDSFTIALLYKKLPEEYKELILSPYIDIENNQTRFTMRVIDSNPNLRRDALIKKIKVDIAKILSKDESFRLSNMMVLYNNMLQSLFDSQIKTLGAVVIILFLMFLALFKSAKIAFIAIISNIIPIGVVFGLMGILSIPLDIMTITIAAISIGIGVDDTIHYIHRFKEEFKKDSDYINAMRRSHNSIGFAMTYTSLAVIVGFSILVLSNLIPTIYFGLLTVLVMITILASALLLLPRLIIILKPFKV